MAFLHTQSCECLKSELLLFEIPPTHTTIEGSGYIQYKPISSLTDDSPIEFIVSGNGEEYIDLAHTLLSLRVSLKRTTDGKLAAQTPPYTRTPLWTCAPPAARVDVAVVLTDAYCRWILLLSPSP
ncbi:hypothetical protein QAD02_021222 [Eretmocerus hayati]|uniref:Uncharacterized protein n=1 Tax=Eretmocerus hayati TaxID=131215 RepID=A0ACC2PS58_9HYME|nr:hypothetical protein QAD02_021222 [Eretmocerus hayati]